MLDGNAQFSDTTDAGRDTVIDSVNDSVSGDSDGNANGISEPEIIHGYPVDEPSTERFAGNATGAEPRRTRTGKIDGRTQRGKRKENQTQSGSLEGLSLDQAIFGLHLLMSETFGVPELMIDLERSKNLSKAVTEYGQFKSKTFNPESVALFNLVAVTAATYGKIIVDVRKRKQSERAAFQARVQPPTPINRQQQQSQQQPNVPQASPSEIFGDMSASL